MVHPATLGKFASNGKAFLPRITDDHLRMARTSRATLSENLETLKAAHPTVNSQRAIATKAGVDQRSAGRALNAEHAASVDALDGFAKAFGLQPWQLLVPGLKAAPLLDGVRVTGLPSWPFSSELRAAVDELTAEDLRHLEGVMRAHLKLEPLPLPPAPRTSEVLQLIEDSLSEPPDTIGANSPSRKAPFKKGSVPAPESGEPTREAVKGAVRQRKSSLTKP